MTVTTLITYLMILNIAECHKRRTRVPGKVFFTHQISDRKTLNKVQGLISKYEYIERGYKLYKF